MFVVNAHGAVHTVPDDWAGRMRELGLRPASAEEIAGWYAMQGLEVPDGGAGDDG